MLMTQDAAERHRVLQGIRGKGRKPDRPHTEAAAGYGRISKISKTKLETQREYVGDYIAGVVQRPWRNEDGFDWFEDDGKSGLRRDRPGYQALLAAVESGRISDVVFFKLDRMSRDDTEVVLQVRRWLERGVHVWDTRIGPITDDNVGLLALIARKEVEWNSQRSSAKLRKLAQAGYKLGGAPIGYRALTQAVMVDGVEKTVRVPGQYVPDEVAGPVMEDVLLMAADPTVSLTAARRYMNTKLGNSYDHQAFKKLLRNPFYKGLTVNFMLNVSLLLERPYGREPEGWEYTEHEHPLCKAQTWDAIQHRLKRGEVCYRNPLNPANAMSGILRCGRCKRRLRPVHPHTGLTAYRCVVCHIVRAESTIKEALAKVLAALDTNPSHSLVVAAESVQDACKALEGQLKADRARIKEIGVERAQLTRQQAQGVISVADYYAALELLGDEAEQVRARIGNVEGMLKNTARGSDLGHVADDVERLRAWCAPKAIRNPKGFDVDEIKTRLQFCCDALTIDPAANTLTVTWSPELALVVGQPTTSVALKGRVRRSQG